MKPTEITELWAICAVDPANNREEIMQVQMGDMWMNMVGSCPVLKDAMRSHAINCAQETGLTVRIKRFTAMTVEETIEPAGKGMVQ